MASVNPSTAHYMYVSIRSCKFNSLLDLIFSLAIHRKWLGTPTLLAQYILNIGTPLWPPMLVTCWISPPPCSLITSIAFFVTAINPKKLTSICCLTCRTFAQPVNFVSEARTAHLLLTQLLERPGKAVSTGNQMSIGTKGLLRTNPSFSVIPTPHYSPPHPPSRTSQSPSRTPRRCPPAP